MKAEDPAVAEIARKKAEAYSKKYLIRVGIVHRQAARWAVKWIASIKQRRKQFMDMLVSEFMPAWERQERRRAQRQAERLNFHLNGYISEEPIVLE
jgi:hypothetical protein